MDHGTYKSTIVSYPIFARGKPVLNGQGATKAKKKYNSIKQQYPEYSIRLSHYANMYVDSLNTYSYGRCPVDQGTKIGLNMQAMKIRLIRSDCAPI